MIAEIVTNNVGRGTLRLDGVDVSDAVSGFTLAGKAGQPTTLTLDLLVTADASGDVVVSPDVHELLIDLGWTPPGGVP